MRQLLPILVAMSLLTGCVYKLSESKIDFIPEQYQAQATPSTVKAYFDTSRGPHNWKYKDPIIEGRMVKAILLGPLDLEVGTVTVQIADTDSGKTVLISLRTTENVYWKEDIDFIRSELYRFLLGGRASTEKGVTF
ncbi:hypothetical protein D3C72_147630 [compost metagenome]